MPRQTADQDRRISETIRREQGCLRNFIRRRVDDVADAEDILQDVFSELVEAYRLMHPVEQVGAWLYRVARNRIIDAFRRKRPSLLADEPLTLEDLLPSPEAGPDAVYARGVLMEAIEAAISELAPEQREVFLAHEMEGRSFKEIAEATGVGLNTLLARKRYAVLHLRRRLRAIHDEYMTPKGARK